MPGFAVALTSSPLDYVGGMEADEHGWCAFPGLSAGSYVLATRPFRCVERQLTLRAGEVLELEFRMPAGMVATTGQCLRAGKLAFHLHLKLRHRGELRSGGVARKGTFRIVLPQGGNQLSLMGSVDPDIPCYQWLQSVPLGVARYAWSASVLCSDLVVEVFESGASAVTSAMVTLTYDPDGVAESQQQSIEKRVARFSWLPPGTYDVSVAGELIASPPPQRITLVRAHRLERLRFSVAPATRVWLQLSCALRHLDLKRHHGLPVLVSDGLPFTVSETRLPARNYGTVRWREFAYTGVPPGQFTLRSRDEVVDEQWRFLAYDLIDDVTAVAQLGRDNKVALHVEKRALVDLRACEKGGREDFRASIEVFAGERRVHTHEVRGCQRFRSFLPPGMYRVVIDRGGVFKEHTIEVARKDLRLRLRP